MVPTQLVRMQRLNNADLNHNIILGCPVCQPFIDTSLIENLYFPDSMEDINKFDFIICDVKGYDTPLILIRDHTTIIRKDIWYKIKLTTRNIFNYKVSIRKLNIINDHIAFYIDKGL